MKPTVADCKAAYSFFRATLFKDAKLPVASKVEFLVKPLVNHGYYGHANGKDFYWINNRTETGTMLLQIVAHEMIHAALKHHEVPPAHTHGDDFKNVATAIEQEMGWPKGSV